VTQWRLPPPSTQTKASTDVFKTVQSASEAHGIVQTLNPAPVSSQFPRTQWSLSHRFPGTPGKHKSGDPGPEADRAQE
jgi:hypothetical protein